MEKSAIMSINPNSLKNREERGHFTVCVVGCGKMGLPHACLFAEAGFKVIGVDKNHRIIEALRKGKSPFEEPGLEEKIKKYVEEGRLTVTSDGKEAASKSDVIILTVDTPIDEKFKPNYSNVERACKELGKGLRPGSLFVVASTVGPGITETLIKERLEKASGLRAGKDFGLAFSPIRATAGRALYDIAHYVRVVGGIDTKSLEVACTVLETIVEAGTIAVSSIRVAEAVKLFQNVYRDVNIALANEFAIFCEKAGIDYLEVQKAANTDPYCHLLVPGLVSGHIPKDPYLLVKEAEDLKVKLRMVKVTRRVNEDMVTHAIRLLKETLKKCGKSFRRAKVAVLGVSYKANVKEPRGSRTLNIIRILERNGVKLKVYDPYFTSKELVELECPAGKNLANTVKGTDCILIAVGHDQFKTLNLKKLKVLMRSPPAIVDLGHVVDPQKAKKEGIVFKGLGRGV